MDAHGAFLWAADTAVEETIPGRFGCMDILDRHGRLAHRLGSLTAPCLVALASAIVDCQAPDGFECAASTIVDPEMRDGMDERRCPDVVEHALTTYQRRPSAVAHCAGTKLAASLTARWKRKADTRHPEELRQRTVLPSVKADR